MSERFLPDWLKAYLTYTNESESPEVYHLWCGISAIASVLERKVSFDMGYFKYYPNQFIVLVSPPGRCKKSSAMRMAYDIFSRVTNKFAAESTSRERLIDDLASSYDKERGQSPLTVHSSEYGSFLTTSGIGMVVFLTDIYDCPEKWAHRTKHSGETTIKKPFLNIVAGTTPNYITKVMPLDTMGVGLSSRTLYIFQDTPRIRPPFPKLSEAQKKLVTLLVADLTNIAKLSGEYVLDQSANDYYTQWYTTRPDASLGDPRISGYLERKPAHVLKVAMCLSAAQTNELVITQSAIENAIALLDEIEAYMPRVFAGVGRNPLNAPIEETLAYMFSRAEGITHGELVERMRHEVGTLELKEVVETLLATRHIEVRGGKYHLVKKPSTPQNNAEEKETDPSGGS